MQLSISSVRQKPNTNDHLLQHKITVLHYLHTDKHTFEFIFRFSPSLLRFLRCVVIKCSKVLEERTTPICRVTELVQLDAEMVPWKQMCLLQSSWKKYGQSELKTEPVCTSTMSEQLIIMQCTNAKNNHHWTSLGRYQVPYFSWCCITPTGLYNGVYLFCEKERNLL